MAKVGRKDKMTRWVEALKEVLDEQNIIYLTDADLVFLTNQKCEPIEQISKETYKKWKSGDKGSQDEETRKEFFDCVQAALIKQKAFLFEKMYEDGKSWQKYAWTLERKFAEWNLTHISKNIGSNEQSTVIQITAANNEQQNLLNSIIFTDYKIIEPEQLKSKNDVDLSTDNNEDDELPF